MFHLLPFRLLKKLKIKFFDKLLKDRWKKETWTINARSRFILCKTFDFNMFVVHLITLDTTISFTLFTIRKLTTTFAKISHLKAIGHTRSGNDAAEKPWSVSKLGKGNFF